MTDLESPKKNNDCYYYYYSTCLKGDSCGFRHEPSALGCETMCSFWKEGKCLNVHCNFRHMELRKNRKAIACYWESQPGGCLKPHCPFMHQNPRPSVSGNEGKSNISENTLPENCNQAGNFNGTTSIDSLVVNFEEESDTESAPTTSPAKTGTPKVKTLEEIKLEKIAAACAAYYSYPSESSKDKQPNLPSGDDLRQRILQRVKSKEMPSQRANRKLSRDELAHILGDDSLKILDNPNLDDNLSFQSNIPQYKRRKLIEKESTTQVIKIKTLDEIRAERSAQQVTRNTLTEETLKKRQHSPVRIAPNKILKINRNKNVETDQQNIDEAEVSSTSNDEPEALPKVKQQIIKPLRKLNLKKIKSLSEDSSQCRSISSNSSKIMSNQDDIQQEHMKALASSEALETTLGSSLVSKTSDVDVMKEKTEDNVPLKNDGNHAVGLERSDSNKTVDESVLLLDDPEEDINVNLKAEDDLLNEIDDLLNE